MLFEKRIELSLFACPVSQKNDFHNERKELERKKLLVAGKRKRRRERKERKERKKREEKRKYRSKQEEYD